MTKPKKSSAGAPRTASNDLPIYDSIQACSNATGIPVSVLKQAKKSGCEAFRHSRVDLGRLLRWLFGKDQDGEGSVNWGERVKKFQALRGELAYEREKKEVISRASVQTGLAELEAIQFGQLDKFLLSEQPPAVVGKSVVQIKQINSGFFQELKNKLKEVLIKTAKGEV
jgi:hypothetical protein